MIFADFRYLDLDLDPADQNEMDLNGSRILSEKEDLSFEDYKSRFKKNWGGEQYKMVWNFMHP